MSEFVESVAPETECSVAQALESAKEKKVLGNNFFNQKEFSKATEHYIEALECLVAEKGSAYGSVPVADETCSELEKDASSKEKIPEKKNVLKCQYVEGEQSKELRTSIMLNCAIAYYKSSKPSSALAYVVEACSLDPRNTKALFWRSQFLISLGEFDQCEAGIKKVLEIDPGHTEVKKLCVALSKARQGAKQSERSAFASMFKSDSKTWYNDPPPTVKSTEPSENSESGEKAETKRAVENAFPPPPRLKPERTESTEIDEEDEQIMKEVTKMGYSYFGRTRDREVAASPAPAPAAQLIPTKECLSTWNAAGATFEEKDKTQWATIHLGKLLHGTKASTKTPERAELLKSLVESTPQLVSGGDAALEQLQNIFCATASAVEVPSVSGEAHVAMMRGTLRYLHELSTKFDLSVTVTPMPGLDGIEAPEYLKPTKYQYKVDLKDISSLESPIVWVEEMHLNTEESVQKIHKKAVDTVIDIFKVELTSTLEAFVKDFHCQK